MKQDSQNKAKSSRDKMARIALLVVLLIEVVLIGALISKAQKGADLSLDEPKIAIDEPLILPNTTNIPPTAIVAATKPDYSIPPPTDGLAPVLSTIPTTEKVVFLGIDDGQNKKPFELQMMKDNNIKASLFLSYRFIKDNPNFFSSFISSGSLIEDHTMDHYLLSKLTYAEQKQEICDEADLFQQLYGRRPVFLRPPGGDYNSDTQKAALDCGMKAVVLWIAKANGGSMQFQIGQALRPGDIVLMHFRPEFKQDMQAFINAQDKAGLHTELLEDWLPTQSPITPP